MDSNVDSATPSEDKKSPARFLLEEIFYQPDAVLAVLQRHLSGKKVDASTFGENAPRFFGRVHRIQIITTPNSHHAGLMARYWLEEIAGIPCQIEMASEYLQRGKVIESNKLCVIISETGEETETVSALHAARDLGYVAILGICNIPQSTLVKGSDIVLMTDPENFAMEVTSAQTFTTQLAGLFLLSIALGRYHRLDAYVESILVKKLENIPEVLERILDLNAEIEKFGKELSERNQVIYLGRDIQLPIAMEGASKLKEICSVNAVAYSPEEFHFHPLGSLGLVSSAAEFPLVALAPSYDFYDKWKTSFQEFREQHHDVFVFSDKAIQKSDSNGMKVLTMPSVDRLFAPMVYTIPMQMLASHAGIFRKEGES
jgi:glucosamine--fructose-6-phosphate aminotransferase (isomerizing)